MRTALVSGGSRGIGKAIASLLASLTDDNGNKLYEVYAPSSREMDVSKPESIDSYFEKNSIQKIDILVNNAGILINKPFLKHKPSEWQHVMDVNLNGVFHLCQKALPMMMEANYGKIINISSISNQGEPYAAAYSTSKGAMISLTKTLAIEFAKYNITVNAICPGWVRTDMAMAQMRGNEDIHLGATLQNRWIEPEEVAEMVKYLISDEAKAITGQSMNITAGLEL